MWEHFFIATTSHKLREAAKRREPREDQNYSIVFRGDDTRSERLDDKDLAIDPACL